jgi:hypothetical protein
VNARKARFIVPNVVEAHGEPIINPVTKKEHRARFNMPNGFEFTLAEVGRGWAKTICDIELNGTFVRRRRYERAVDRHDLCVRAC